MQSIGRGFDYLRRLKLISKGRKVETIGIDKFRIAYSAIPRCANTSLKLALFELQTGREFQRYLGDGSLWPHSTSKLEIHRNDIEEFNHLKENDLEIIESNYEFWFTIIDNPLRRLFSSYYMLILLEDPHLTAANRDLDLPDSLDNLNLASISTHFEEFVGSDFLRTLMEIDVHFMPQSKILENVKSSNKLRIYGLNELQKVEHDLNEFLRRRDFIERIRIPKSNISLVNLSDVEISELCRTNVETLYQQDLLLVESKGLIIEDNSKVTKLSKNESFLNDAINELRDRNRRISIIYRKYIEEIE